MGLFGSWRIRKAADDNETVYIAEKFGVRTLHIGSDTVQSAMRLNAPLDLELSYTRSMMGFLLFNDAPKSVLMVGLGGGSVAKFVHRYVPDTHVRVIEISERVLTVARRYFDVPENNERFEVVIGDGAEYVTRDSVSADVIMVDGYDGESHVEAVSTQAFYKACHDRLSADGPGGVLVVNLWGGDRQFNETLKRIERAFPAGTACLPAERPGNVIVFGFRSAPGNLAWLDLEARAERLKSRYELEFPRFVEALRRMNRHDAKHLLF